MSQPIRILILEDRAADAELVTRELRHAGFDFVIKRATTEQEFLAGLRNYAAQVILADYSLPTYDGYSALAAAQQQCPATPFIFVSGSLGEERAVESLHRGATDYVLKDRLARLGPAVRRALREREEMRKRKQAEQERHEAEARYRALFDQSPDGIVIIDPETARPLEFNAAAHQQLGYSREEFAQLSLADIEAAETPEQTRANIDAVRREGKRDFETRQRTREGQVRHVHVTAKTIGVSGRSVYHCIWRDITDRKQAEAALRESERRYSDMLGKADLIAMTLDRDARVTFCNKYLLHLTGWRREEILGSNWFERFIPGENDELKATFVSLLNDLPAAAHIENEILTRSGERRLVRWNNTVLRSAAGEVIGTASIGEDITERKQAEQRVRELNLMLRASGAINALMVRERDPKRLLAEACKILVETRGYQFAWVGLVEPGSKRVVPAAQAGKDAGYLDAVKVTWDETLTGQGPTGTAIRTRQPMICQNTATDPRFAPWREEAMARGFASMAAMPMIRGSRVLGAVSVYFVRTAAFLADELELLKELAADLAFALQSIEQEQEHERAETRLHLLSEALESAANAIVITDREGTITWANSAISQLSGYPLAEVLGRKPSLFKSGEHDQAYYQKLWKTVLAGKVWSSEMVNRRKDGSLYTEETTITPVRNELDKITHFIAVKQDITERKRAAEDFRQVSNRLLLATRAAEVGIWDHDLLNDKLVWDDAMFRLYGISPEHFDGAFEAWQAGVHPEDLARTNQEVQMALRGEKDLDTEFRVLWPDNSVHYIKANGLVQRDASGRPVRTVGTNWDITQRNQLELALHESSQFNQQIIASAQEGIVVYDRDLKYQVWNPFMEELKGMPAREVLGKHPDELFPFLREAGMVASLQKALAGEPTPPLDLHFEVPLSGKSGWASHTNGPLLNATGEIVGVIGIVRDITERKRAEVRVEAFSRLGQRLSAAKTAREAAGIISGVAGELIGWNACLFSLCSPSKDLLNHVLQVDTIDGRRVEYCPGYESPSVLARRAIESGGQLVLKEQPDQMLSGGQPFGNASRPSTSIMYVPVRKGTEVIGVMSVQSYTPRAYDSRSLETLQALADHCGGALDRLRMHEAWETSQERLGHLLNQSPAVIYSLKTDGQTTEPAWVSDNVERLLGYTAAESIGPEGLFSQFSPEARQNFIDCLVQLLGRKQITRDFRVQHKNGDYLWVRDEQRLVCDAAGAPVEIVGSWVDITERKALEEQLRQSQKMEAVGQLAGGVAHDFNNMLAVIRGNAELLLMDEAEHTAETNESLEHVVEASERAANLTRQLLAFSRKQVLLPQPLVLNEVIANLTKMLKRLIGENIDLQCHYAASLPYVQADTGMMEQVILNLVVNARDAMPAGGQLRVKTEQLTLDDEHARANPKARAGEFVCLLVGDTGTGIAPEVLPRIFEPFFTTKELGKGTGLGLATVYGIVQQHQGWIEVSSQVGKGSMFKVILPSIPIPALTAAASEAGAVIRGGNEMILLVEDEHAVRVTTRRVLESKGYRILEATSGREALEVWHSHAKEIALLLTDIIMPGDMTGRDLAERLHGQLPGMKVIFMSGYSADVMGKNTDFIRRTRSYFLQKPCSAQAILETVRRCLDEKEAVAAPDDAGQDKWRSTTDEEAQRNAEGTEESAVADALNAYVDADK